MSDLLMPCGEPAAGDCIAATRAWLERAVIGLNLCPFAKAVHHKQQIRYAVTAAGNADELLAELAHELGLLAGADAETHDTTLLIHPQVMKNLELDGVLQIASLHPAYEFAGSAPDAIENCSNRSPYPTLHLLRESSIDRAVAAFPDASAIYDRNIATLRQLGHAGWQQLWTKTP